MKSRMSSVKSMAPLLPACSLNPGNLFHGGFGPSFSPSSLLELSELLPALARRLSGGPPVFRKVLFFKRRKDPNPSLLTFPGIVTGCHTCFVPRVAVCFMQRRTSSVSIRAEHRPLRHVKIGRIPRRVKYTQGGSFCRGRYSPAEQGRRLGGDIVQDLGGARQHESARAARAIVPFHAPRPGQLPAGKRQNPNPARTPPLFRLLRRRRLVQ